MADPARPNFLARSEVFPAPANPRGGEAARRVTMYPSGTRALKESMTLLHATPPTAVTRPAGPGEQSGAHPEPVQAPRQSGEHLTAAPCRPEHPAPGVFGYPLSGRTGDPVPGGDLTGAASPTSAPISGIDIAATAS